MREYESTNKFIKYTKLLVSLAFYNNAIFNEQTIKVYIFKLFINKNVNSFKNFLKKS